MTSKVQGTPFGSFIPHGSRPHRALPPIPQMKPVTAHIDLNKRPPCPPPRTDLIPPPLPARDPVDSKPVSSEPEQSVTSNGRKWVIAGGCALAGGFALAAVIAAIVATIIFAPFAAPVVAAIGVAGIIAIAEPLLCLSVGIALAGIGVLSNGVHMQKKEKQAAAEAPIQKKEKPQSEEPESSKKPETSKEPESSKEPETSEGVPPPPPPLPQNKPISTPKPKPTPTPKPKEPLAEIDANTLLSPSNVVLLNGMKIASAIQEGLANVRRAHNPYPDEISDDEWDDQ